MMCFSKILFNRTLAVALASVSALCALAQTSSGYEDYLREPLPQQWLTGSDNADQCEAFPASSGSQWWTQLGDATLDSLIVRGLEHNYDVLLAARRIETSRLALESTRGGYFPTLGVGAGWTKSQSSGRLYDSYGKASQASYFNIGANVSWEVDLFGRISAATGKQKQLYRASKAEYDGMMLSVAAQIASAYVQIRTWQGELKVAKEHIASQGKVVKITQARHEAGLASALDVAQSQMVYESTVASLPMLENQITTGINSLAILLGVYPEELSVSLKDYAPLPPATHLVSVCTPLDLLRRRPDIAQAQAQLEAQLLAIGIAKKDYLPTLTINGSLGTSAHNAGDLMGKQSLTYSIAPTLSWTVFDGMQRKYNVAIAREQMEAQIDSYNLAVMTAVQEAQNAMYTYQASLRYIDCVRSVISQAERALQLSVDLYKRGLNPFNDVMTAQMTYLQYQEQEVEAQGSALSALISLYKAIGG